ncbi:MAG: hypothetical protein AAF401_15535, partial [Pseudomonadota bacterium]
QELRAFLEINGFKSIIAQLGAAVGEDAQDDPAAPAEARYELLPGFEFDIPEEIAETPDPSDADLSQIRGDIAAAIAGPYPKFAAQVFGAAA